MDQYTSQEEWNKWLLEERHILPSVIKQAGLIAMRGELSIPVRDVDGKLLFCKHRRPFTRTTGPKYRYDKGATAALFGAETLKSMGETSTLIITEGELDALAVRSLGYHAVSSTGGAGTWKQEWSDLIQTYSMNAPVILYDADKAGVEGALRVANSLFGARIGWVPVQFGKDPTDVIASGHSHELVAAIERAKAYPIKPIDDTVKRIANLKLTQSMLLAERRDTLADPEATPFHVDLALDWVEKEIEDETFDPAPRPSGVDGSDKEKARAYPIKDLIKVTREGKALCPFHDDRTPSLHVYKDNHAYCFVCSKRADAIDVYMAVNSCDFKTALAALSV